MGIQRWKGGLSTMVACAAASLLACTDGDMFAEGDEAAGAGGEPVEEPGSDELSDPERGEEVEAIIPDTTKVLSEDARAALVSYDKRSGTLRFDRSSAGKVAARPYHFSDPTELEVGDVVVSEVAAAAPTGLIGRVAEVVEDGQGVTVRTTEADIGDAVERASLSKRIPMEDLEVAYVAPGLKMEAGPVESQERALIGVGFQGYGRLDFPQNYDFGTNGACRLLVPKVYEVVGAAILGLSVNGPSVSEFGIISEATSNLDFQVQCNQSAVNTNLWLGGIVSPIYVDYIGGIVPIIYQYGLGVVGGIEHDQLDTTFTVRAQDQFEAGVGWQSGVGWGPWAGHTVHNFDWTARGNGKTKLKVGPAFAISMYAEVNIVDVFDWFSWIDIGFGAGATGVVYAPTFLEANSSQNLETGTGSATLHAGMEAAAAAGILINLSVGIWGFDIYNETWRWVYQHIFPIIRYQLASVTF